MSTSGTDDVWTQFFFPKLRELSQKFDLKQKKKKRKFAAVKKKEISPLPNSFNDV